jgi:maltooligosyltrehalose trehalohydrolase
MSRNPIVEVWAPDAREVILDTGKRQARMVPGENGWWSAPAPPHPFRYAFLLNGGSPLPDPRSPSQPDGVHGRSASVDHAAFPWSDLRWQAPPLASGVIYELHTGTFTPEGTFDSAIERLPYLRDLGITHVELMPVAEFSGDWGWGYDGVDLWAPHHAYGGPEGLKRLVNALHEHGMAAILDVVYNHLGPDGNYLAQFGPYFTKRHSTPWGDAVNLYGPHSTEVRRFFIDNALMWLRDYHFDGLRLDAVHTFIDLSAVHFLEELAEAVSKLELELGRHLAVIAESDLNDPRIVQVRESGGYGFAAQWSDDFHHAVHAVVTGERDGYYSDFGSFEQLAKALERGFVYDGCTSRFRGRPHGRPLGMVPKSRLVCAIQNHDQVGNRARGERLGMLIRPERLKIAAALLLCSPFIPMLFQGEEWNTGSPFLYFTNYLDPALGRAVSEGRRLEFSAFGWRPEAVPDPQDPETFRRSKLAWDELPHGSHAEILGWYRRLIALRQQMPALRSGPVNVRFEEGRWLAIDRGGVTLQANLGTSPARIPHAHGMHLALASGEDVRCEDGAAVLPADAVAILSTDEATRWIPETTGAAGRASG